MYQVKFFKDWDETKHRDMDYLESKINNWLKDNPTYRIVNVSLTSNDTMSKDFLFAVVTYEC